ncbi:MAG: ATP synthase subunit I [Cyanobacteria bacterium P01_D01_bin.156]
MTSSEEASEAQPNDELVDEPIELPPASDQAMGEYFRLQQNLLMTTLGFTAFIFISVWLAYSRHIALNYLLGACVGVVYLRMLAKSVAKIGRERTKLGSGRLAVFMGLIVFATQYQQLEIMPVFLGFLTYKAALIAYTLWTSVLPESMIKG